MKPRIKIEKGGLLGTKAFACRMDGVVGVGSTPQSAFKAYVKNLYMANQVRAIEQMRGMMDSPYPYSPLSQAGAFNWHPAPSAGESRDEPYILIPVIHDKPTLIQRFMRIFKFN